MYKQLMVRKKNETQRLSLWDRRIARDYWRKLVICGPSIGADTITINPLKLQNGPRNLKEDHFLTQKLPSKPFGTALMDQDGAFLFRILAGFSYVHSAKGYFKSSFPNCSEGGFWVRKWSSFRFRGTFCNWRGFIVIVSAPTHQPFL